MKKLEINEMEVLEGGVDRGDLAYCWGGMLFSVAALAGTVVTGGALGWTFWGGAAITAGSCGKVFNDVQR